MCYRPLISKAPPNNPATLPPKINCDCDSFSFLFLCAFDHIVLSSFISLERRHIIIICSHKTKLFSLFLCFSLSLSLSPFLSSQHPHTPRLTHQNTSIMASAAAAAPATASTSASHPYTCNSCQVAYRNIDLQKGHMRSDWQYVAPCGGFPARSKSNLYCSRYNLKRRVASLPPISADVFTEKVIQARAATDAEAGRAYFERSCDTCQKTYSSENAYQNHMTSQKHKAKLASSGYTQPEDDTSSVVTSTFSLGDPVAVRRDSVDSDAEEEFNAVVEGFNRANISHEQRPSPVKRPSNPQPAASDNADQETAEETRDADNKTPVQPEPTWTLESCLFCNYKSPTVPLNAHHMERFHNMFIPERAYLVDLDGLMNQLQQKVHDGHECLYCGKYRSTAFACQTHMRDKGHCIIPFETEEQQLEIGEHYDFRSTYSDDEEEEDEDEDEEAIGGAKLGGRRTTKTTGPDGEEIEKEVGDGWETDSSASSLDSEDLTAVPAEGHIHQYERLDKHPHHTSKDPRARHRADGWHSHAHKHTHAVFYDEYELHLPSGKSVGHRSLNKYYRQNLTHYPTPEERALQQQIEDGRHFSDDEDAPPSRTTGRSRAVVPRGEAGLVGVSDRTREVAKRQEQRARTQGDKDAKKKDYAYGKKLNNQKQYYYRYERGG